MRPQQLIAKKRDGGVLDDAQIVEFIRGVCDESWADYQVTAMIMAMFINGLNVDEQDSLTRAMLHSGEVLNLSEIEAPKADKHSTGGVGDKTSLIIAPLAAACGLAVPMISGRALGHTGGTLDKLESIQGYDVNLTVDRFRETIRECGFAMSGQTADIAPADKKLYALRDATATVPCIPLIVGSIMSKKLAEGLDVLVVDVKTGSGAFMRSFDESKRLAEALVRTGNKFGVRTSAVVSDMSQPLGEYAGNALEVFECIKIMRGEGTEAMVPTRELSLELAARMLYLAGIDSEIESARQRAAERLDDGSALERFRRNVEVQGGDPGVCDHPESLLEDGMQVCPIEAGSDGFVIAIDTFIIGNSIVEMGGGRTRTDDRIDRGVGFQAVAKIGSRVARGETIGSVYCRSDAQAERARQMIGEAFTLADEAVAPPPLIGAVIGDRAERVIRLPEG